MRVQLGLQQSVHEATVQNPWRIHPDPRTERPSSYCQHIPLCIKHASCLAQPPPLPSASVRQQTSRAACPTLSASACLTWTLPVQVRASACASKCTRSPVNPEPRPTARNSVASAQNRLLARSGPKKHQEDVWPVTHPRTRAAGHTQRVQVSSKLLFALILPLWCDNDR